MLPAEPTSMFTPRRSYRIRIALPATLDVVADADDADTPATKLDGCTLDLSQDGVGVFAPVEVPVGQVVRVIVEEPGPRHRRLRRWSGTIVNVRAGDEGYRLGIAFDAPDEGPALSLRVERGGGRSALVRVDPPWGEAAQPEAETEVDRAPERPAGAPRSGPDAGLLRIFQATIVLGFFVDQLTKAHAFAAGLTPNAGTALGLFQQGAPVKNFGLLGGVAAGLPLGREAMGLLGLVLTGVVGRLALEARPNWTSTAAAGWGCLFAGVFGNTADRLVLGFVRDFLRSRLCPSWTFNVADLLTLAGALLLLATTAARGVPGPIPPRRVESPDLRARTVPLGP
jgi:lipoprotein signal peptidase